MADPLTNSGIIPPSDPPLRSWTEPAPYGCEFYLPIDPARRSRSARILAEAQAKLDQKGA